VLSRPSISVRLLNQVDHIFVFNLRSYDRLNTTQSLKKQEEKAGVKYQEVQRAEAEEIMGTGVHPATTTSSDQHAATDSGDEREEKAVDRKRQFEAHREDQDSGEHVKPPASGDSIAKDAMKGQRKVSEEPWDDDDKELELRNFVQEELYIHAKVCIIDDRTVICGSSNINDRVNTSVWLSVVDLLTAL
jgi:phospholipase D1/2